MPATSWQKGFHSLDYQNVHECVIPPKMEVDIHDSSLMDVGDSFPPQTSSSDQVSLNILNIEDETDDFDDECEGNDVQMRTLALLRGLVIVLRHHGANDEVIESMKSQLIIYLGSSPSEMVWMKRSKYVLSFPLAKYLDNNPPPTPDLEFKFSGVFSRWCKNRLYVFNRKNTHLWSSWLQCKRSALPASDDLVDQAYTEHQKTLTSPDLGNPVVIDEIFNNKSFIDILSLIRKDLAYLIDSKEFTEYPASYSACFDKTRSNGGQWADLKEMCGSVSLPVGTSVPKRDHKGRPIHVYDEDGEKLEDIYKQWVYEIDYVVSPTFTPEYLQSMSWSPVCYHNGQKYSSFVKEKRIPYGKEEWDHLKHIIYQLRHLYKACNLRPRLRCTIQAVLEPMKIRIISKGESLYYYAIKPLQKALHSSMRKLSCFRLIGRSFSPCDLLDLRRGSKLIDGEEWFSVDYSAATDGISWEYTSRILRYLVGNLSDYWHRFSNSVLGPHDLYYPLPCGGKEFRGTQKNGQLMGSILSFPILCLANLGVYLLNMQDEMVGWTLQEKMDHVLINGDDMLYIAQPDKWASHCDISDSVGLKMSVGKSYHHNTYANINSVSLHYDLRSQSSTPFQINFLNTGLILGQHKVMESDSADEIILDELGKPIHAPSFHNFEINRNYDNRCEYYAKIHSSRDPSKGIVSNMNSILAGCLPGKEKEIMKFLLSEHSETIKKDCSVYMSGTLTLHNRNLFLPISRGGMGVVPPIDWKFRISPKDRLIAGYLQENAFSFSTSYPLPGRELIRTPEEDYPWIMKPLNPFDLEFSKSMLRRFFKVKKSSIKLPMIQYSVHSNFILF